MEKNIQYIADFFFTAATYFVWQLQVFDMLSHNFCWGKVADSTLVTLLLC